MSQTKYTIGVDYGTESGRVVLIDVADGREVAEATHPYANGVITDRLPGTDIKLEPDWALQDPQDYLAVLEQAIPQVLKVGGVDPAHIIGFGIDFTSATIMPTLADGTPLCFLPEWRANPHAWVKLWKHHAAQPEANKMTDVAQEMGYTFLERYGEKVSSEWTLPKVWQTLNEAPELYEAADRIIEAGDWIVWQLTGQEKRSAGMAGYKSFWSKREGYPPDDFFNALDPRLAQVVDHKFGREVYPLGSKAGALTTKAAQLTGLQPDTAVAIANIDAHVSAAAGGIAEKVGRMVIIMGTSNCHLVTGETEHVVPGICGYVEDGIVSGYLGYEAGQSCMGDHFAWFVKNCVPAAYTQEATARGMDIHQLLEEKAARLKPGESGLVALDWWNGNRSILVDVDLTGLLLGATLATKPEEIYRALIEATAYGTRVIIENFEKNDVAVEDIVATGGLPGRNKLLMQIFADVTGRAITVSGTSQGGALGAAMHAAVAAGQAAGGYESIVEASQYMVHLSEQVYQPNPEHQQIYDQLFAEYLTLHDYFGRGTNNVMKRLKQLKAQVRAAGQPQQMMNHA
ncbi:MAG: ribulokinase [Anaerolineae bacterium]|nr:ribulokinase [Anaerolineae bacterium]